MPKIFADFESQFKDYLNNLFGNTTASFVWSHHRCDLDWRTADMICGDVDSGIGGSTNETMNVPIIFVHGAGTDALWAFERIKSHYRRYNFTDSEFYSINWGVGNNDYGGSRIEWIKNSLDCAHIRRYRLLIKAVASFNTNGKVNIVALSMGSPIARKAILGGTCVDTGEQLGVPLTHLVNVFLSLAGANWGSQWCSLLSSSAPICNRVNGLDCESAFLKDINAQTGYEGRFVYALYSNTDYVVGTTGCDGKQLAQIEGATANYEVKGDHGQTMNGPESIELQIKLLRNSGDSLFFCAFSTFVNILLFFVFSHNFSS